MECCSIVVSLCGQAALDQVKADLKDLKSKVKDDKAGLKAAKQVLNQARKSGSQKKIKEASKSFHKQRREFAQDVKKIKRQEAGISKLQKVLGVSANQPPPVLSLSFSKASNADRSALAVWQCSPFSPMDSFDP